jgi:hypothetical protein
MLGYFPRAEGVRWAGGVRERERESERERERESEERDWSGGNGLRLELGDRLKYEVEMCQALMKNDTCLSVLAI